MKEKLPSITIAIPNRNGSRYLRECIESILSQDYPRLELFFCDGCSTDDSLSIAREYEHSFRKITSLADSGPAEAINRALMAATGQVFQWINSDDILEPGALHSIGRSFTKEPRASLVAGRVINFQDADKSYAGCCDNKNLSYSEFYRYCCALKTKLNWHQPGCWWKRSALVSAGGINAGYKAYFDRELFLRLLRSEHKINYIDRNLVKFRFHDNQISHETSNWKRRELRKIIKYEATINPGFCSIYSTWIKAYYWNKRLSIISNSSTKANLLDIFNFCFEILKDPAFRLRPHSGTKQVLFSMTVHNNYHK